MKRIAIYLFLMITSFTLSNAQEKIDDVKKLIQLVSPEKTIDGIMNNMINLIKQQAQSKIQGENALVKYKNYTEFLMQETTALTKKLIDVEMVNIYDKHFTHNEIKDMVAFYNTPTGKKLIEKTPEISNDLVTTMINKYMPEFQQKIQSKLEEYSK